MLGFHEQQFAFATSRAERGATTLPRPRVVLAVQAAAIAFAVAACGGGSDNGSATGPDPNPTTGFITVVTSTTGDNLDGDGYNIILADSVVEYGVASFEIVDDTTIGGVGANETVITSELPPGDHIVLLDGLKYGCSPEGDGVTPATVAAGDTTEITLTVTCGHPSLGGQLTVSTSTTGANVDPDGYVVSVDFGDEQPIGTDEELFIEQAAVGEPLVWLRGVADNCTVDGGDLHRIDLPEEAKTTLQLSIACQ